LLPRVHKPCLVLLGEIMKAKNKLDVVGCEEAYIIYMLQNKKVCKEVPHNHQDARLRMPLIIDLSRHWRRSCNDGAVWTLTMALADCCCSRSQGDDTVPPTHCNFQLTSGVYITSEKDDGPFDSRRYTAAAAPRLENLFVVMFEVSRRSAQATKQEKMCARLRSRSVFSRGVAAPLVERRGGGGSR
jgi:hypothetical protein